MIDNESTDYKVDVNNITEQEPPYIKSYIRNNSLLSIQYRVEAPVNTSCELWNAFQYEHHVNIYC